MLSFDEGRPIAIIKNGKYDGKILRLTTNIKEKPDIKEDPIEYLGEDYFKSKKKKITLKEMLHIKKAMDKDIEPIEDDLIEIYKNAKVDLNKGLSREFKIFDDGQLYPIPLVQSKDSKEKQREVILVSGASGSGKSYYVSKYAEMYKDMFKDRKIFIFSRVKEDKALDKLGATRIMLDETFIEGEPMTADDFEKCLVIMDDVSTISNKKIKDAVELLMSDILETGRHRDIYMAITNHLLNNYGKTKLLLNESNAITVFPHGGTSKYAISYFLKNYVGASREQIRKILSLKSRWITVLKSYPQCILHSGGSFIL